MFCESCKKHVDDNNWSSHTMGKAHKKSSKEYQDSRLAIFVSNITPQITENVLRQHFSQYGQVTKARIHGNKYTGIVSFSDANSAVKACGRQHHNTRGGHVKVRAFKPQSANRQDEQKLRAAKSQSLLDKLHHSIQAYDDTDEQMLCLVREWGLTESRQQAIAEAVYQLQQAIQTIIPEAYLRPFGSAVSGLGTSSCDLDVVLILQDKEIHKTGNGPLTMPILRKVPVKQGYLDYNCVRDLAASDTCLLLMSVLKHSSLTSYLSRFTPIPTARIPILKFQYLPIKLDVDLSFGASLSLENTRLIQLLLRLDSRVRILMISLRYWLKCAGFADENNRVTSYALFLVLYFYLQNTQPPVLPSVEQLANLARYNKEVGGWDCAFSEDIELIQRKLLNESNTQNTSELLAGFFTYYAHIDLLCTVLCVRSGTVATVTNFRKMIQDDPRVQPFKVESLCLQDPFELSHNALRNINLKMSHHFSVCIHQGAACVSQGPTNWDLTTLIPDAPVNMDESPAPRTDPQTISIPLRARELPKLFWNCLCTDDLKVRWHQWVMQLLMKCLRVWKVTCFNNDETLKEFEQHSSKRKQDTEEDHQCTKRQRIDQSTLIEDEHSPSAESPSIFDSEEELLRAPSCSRSTVTYKHGSSTQHKHDMHGNITRETKLHCQTMCKIWTNKRDLPNQFKNINPKICPLDIEEKITTDMFSNTDLMPLMEEALVFDITLKTVVCDCVTYLNITIGAETPSTELELLKTFFMGYAAKLLKLILQHESHVANN